MRVNLALSFDIEFPPGMSYDDMEREMETMVRQAGIDPKCVIKRVATDRNGKIEQMDMAWENKNVNNGEHRSPDNQ